MKVIDIALAEIGYLEKASNNRLDDKTENAGKRNYTKYARDLDAIAGFYNGKKNGQAWCDVFVDWCFVKAYGIQKARDMIYQPKNSLGAGCLYSAMYYKQSNAFYKTPKVGDQIFFVVNGSVGHTGIVYKVDKKKVYTIEGNTSGANGVIANGGGVCKKSYTLGYDRIYGYGRPKYDDEIENMITVADEMKKAKKEEGIEMTMSVLKKGNAGSEVKTLQVLLIHKFGLSCGTAGIDGSFGSGTDKSVKLFQSKKGLVADGIVGAKTWNELLK